MAKRNVSLRVKLLATFVLCMVLSFVLFYIQDYITRDIRTEYYTSYESSKNVVREQSAWIEHKLSQIHNDNELSFLLNHARKRGNGVHIYLTDADGKVLYHSVESTETRLDIYRILYDTKVSLQDPASGKPYGEVKPVIFRNQNLYLVVLGSLSAEQGVNYKFDPLLNSAIFVAIFTLLFYWFTRNKMRQIQDINKSVQEIANGNLQIRLPHYGQDELGTLSHNINVMAKQLQEKIAREKAVEQSKIDLITNLSHDLRTPLTSIIGYLTLLKEKNHRNSEEMSHYIINSYNKAHQLKN